MGGGACIPTALDFRIGSADCVMRYPEVDLGINLSWKSLPLCVHLVGAARAKRRAAEAELEAIRLDAIGETWDAYFRVRAYRRQYDFGVALVESSEEAFEAVASAYREGLATITTLVQAERDLQGSNATFIDARADLLVAAADLAFAAGTEIGRTTMPAGSPR